MKVKGVLETTTSSSDVEDLGWRRWASSFRNHSEQIWFDSLNGAKLIPRKNLLGLSVMAASLLLMFEIYHFPLLRKRQLAVSRIKPDLVFLFPTYRGLNLPTLWQRWFEDGVIRLSERGLDSFRPHEKNDDAAMWDTQTWTDATWQALHKHKSERIHGLAAHNPIWPRKDVLANLPIWLAQEDMIGVEAQWGQTNRVVHRMLETALAKYPGATHFIFATDSSMPMKRADEIYDEIARNPKTRFDLMKGYFRRRHEADGRIELTPKHGAYMSLTRSHARVLVATKDQWVYGNWSSRGGEAGEGDVTGSSLENQNEEPAGEDERWPLAVLQGHLGLFDFWREVSPRGCTESYRRLMEYVSSTCEAILERCTECRAKGYYPSEVLGRLRETEGDDLREKKLDCQNTMELVSQPRSLSASTYNLVIWSTNDHEIRIGKTRDVKGHAHPLYFVSLDSLAIDWLRWKYDPWTMRKIIRGAEIEDCQPKSVLQKIKLGLARQHINDGQLYIESIMNYVPHVDQPAEANKYVDNPCTVEDFMTLFLDLKATRNTIIQTTDDELYQGQILQEMTNTSYTDANAIRA